MMLALGMFVFIRQTLPYQSLQRDAAYTWASNKRVGRRNAFQFTGVGNDTITLSGALYPELTSGGPLSLSALRLMASAGLPWPLVDGSGMIYGMYIIESVTEIDGELYPDGSPRKIDFTVKLTRVDDLLGMIRSGIHEQIQAFINKPGDLAANSSVLGAN